MGDAAGLRALADTPEEREWPLHDSRDVPSPGLILQEEASRRVDDRLKCGLVELADRSLLFVECFGLEPGRHLRFDLGRIGPAEPRLVAIGAQPRRCRIHAIPAG